MEKNYKDTLSLPNTQFPMKPNGTKLVDLEAKIREYWQNINIFQLTRRKEKQTKYLHFGPPYANNNLHVGHGSNMILKDILVRFWNLCGYNSLTRPGHDCHGLPIEINVLKKYGKGLTTQEFRKRSREEAKFWIEKQSETMDQLGLLAPKEYYTTMDNTVDIYKVFSENLLNNKVFLAKKVLPWSIVEQTVISEAEIEYKDIKSKSVYVQLELKDQKNTYVLIWTTTPWSLPNNTGVAINSEHQYVKAQYENGNIIFLKQLQQSIEKNLNIKFHHCEPINIDDYVGKYCKHPINPDVFVPIVHSDHVTCEDGTGVVHIAPANGVEDFALYEKGKLDIADYITHDGFFHNTVEKLNGLHIFDNSEEIILELLGSSLLGTADIIHRYPFASRSLNKETKLILKATEQVFLNIKTIRDKKYLEEKLGNVSFYPISLKSSLIDLIANRSEWCISRQRTWGVPLCMFLHKKTHEILINQQLQEKIIKQLEKDVDYFFHKDSINILEGIVNKDDYYAYLGVLDVWFDSGCSFKFVTNKQENLPVAQVYLEGRDQIRGWFQSSLLTNLLFNEKIPYENVVSHGFIVDQNGYKISKSMGNGVPLNEILDNFGTEILRLWIVYIDYSAANMKLGKNLLEDTRMMYRKIRNVMRYLISINETMKPEDDFGEITDVIDKAIMEKCQEVHRDYMELMENFNFNRAFNKLFNFITYVSSFYFSVKKDTLYCDSDHSAKKISAKKTCKSLLIVLNILLSPILPFTMEEIFLHCKLFNVKSVHMLDNTIVENILFNHRGMENATLIDRIYDDLYPLRCQLEEMLQNKVIKSSLETEIHHNLAYSDDLVCEVMCAARAQKSDELFVAKIEHKTSCLRCKKPLGSQLCDRCSETIK